MSMVRKGKRTGQLSDARGKRPAARGLAGEYGYSSNNKVLKSEYFKGEENDKKVKLSEASARENEEKTEPEKELKHIVENSINVEEKESMEFDLPVKSSNKKRKFVIESDSGEETTKEKDISGKRKRNSSSKKKPSPPVKDTQDDVVQKSAQGSPKNPKQKELSQNSPIRDKNNSSPSLKMPGLRKGSTETSSSFRYLKTLSDADMTHLQQMLCFLVTEQTYQL